MKHHTSNRIYYTVEPLFFLSLENDVMATSKRCVFLSLVFILKYLGGEFNMVLNLSESSILTSC